eukprot:CAMPEP_0116885560 /NCGR_PEP_ID=MMETSP0463-20121206/19004_1 /TAXON_ID=181622 /ORGANISM="Strombidinopsis sp, Strain SopsisLIS2011" /LENGTH=43 /DNA_ID= /DNA_START= /DNA_END= /DNA_ORIENTATION=
MVKIVSIPYQHVKIKPNDDWMTYDTNEDQERLDRNIMSEEDIR